MVVAREYDHELEDREHRLGDLTQWKISDHASVLTFFYQFYGPFFPLSGFSRYFGTSRFCDISRSLPLLGPPVIYISVLPGHCEHHFATYLTTVLVSWSHGEFPFQ